MPNPPESPRASSADLEALRLRIDDFEQGLRSLHAILASFPTSKQADRAIAVDARLARIGRQVRAGTVLLVLVVALLGAGMLATAQDNVTWEGNRQGIQCLIQQAEEHRHANKAAHEAFAKELGAPYDVPAERKPPPIPEHLEEACAPFLGAPD